MNSRAKGIRFFIGICLVVAVLGLLPACDGGGSSISGGADYTADWPAFWNLSMARVVLECTGPDGIGCGFWDVPLGASYANRLIKVPLNAKLYIRAYVRVSTKAVSSMSEAEVKYWAERSQTPHGPDQFRTLIQAWAPCNEYYYSELPYPKFTWQDVQSWGGSNRVWTTTPNHTFTVRAAGQIHIYFPDWASIKELYQNDNQIDLIVEIQKFAMN